MKKVIIILSLIFVATSCGGSAEKTTATAADSTKKDVALIVTSANLEVKPFSHKVEIQGQVETDQNIMLNAEANGVIKRISVKEGQRVSKGQTLVIIDSELISTSMGELKNSLDLASFMYEKQKTLNAKGLGTEIDLEQAKNQKSALEAKLRSLEGQKSKTVVKAPFAGVIDQIFTYTGEMASPAAPLMRLVNNSDMKITASVSENYLGEMKMGTPVEVVFPTMNNYVVNSNISYIGNYIDDVNRTFRVQVKLKNDKDRKFLPNQLVKVNITDFKLDSAFVITKDAILQNTSNENYVYLMTKAENDTYSVEQVFIKILSSYKGEAAIASIEPNQLKANSRIVLAGGKGITPSDKVKLQKS